MKRFLTTLILALVGLGAVGARAGILIGSMSTITTAVTNSPPIQTNTAYLSLPQISVSNNGLSMTNAYNGSFRWSIDNGATWFTNASPQFNPAVTNAGTTVIASQTVALPIIVEMQATTNVANTTTIQMGVTSP